MAFSASIHNALVDKGIFTEQSVFNPDEIVAILISLIGEVTASTIFLGEVNNATDLHVSSLLKMVQEEMNKKQDVPDEIKQGFVSLLDRLEDYKNATNESL